MLHYLLEFEAGPRRTAPSHVGPYLRPEIGLQTVWARKFDRDLLRLATIDPTTGGPLLCRFNSLPFGRVGSVAGSVWQAVWYTGIAGLRLCETG